MMAEMNAEMDGNQAETRSKFDAWLMDVKDSQNETIACNEATEIKPNPEMMQSIEEHQETPKGEATVMLVGELRSGVGSAVWPQSATRGGRKGLGEIVDVGRRRPPLAGRCPTTQSGMVKKEPLEESCAPHRELTTAGMRMTCSAKLARLMGHTHKRYNQDSMGQETQKQRKDWRRLWKGLECNNMIPLQCSIVWLKSTNTSQESSEI
jgi:hypothetical protein